MNRTRFLVVGLGILALAATQSFGRSILERKAWYLSESGKSAQARFWVVFLGNHDVTLTKKFPGEPEQQVKASVNFQLISSGYVEGNGYSVKGKIDCLPLMMINGGQGERKIEIDSIDCIYDYGQKVLLTNGETGDFIVDLEGQKLSAKRFLMREYKLVDYYGEEILKEGSEETQIKAIAFSKEGLARAQKAGVAK